MKKIEELNKLFEDYKKEEESLKNNKKIVQSNLDVMKTLKFKLLNLLTKIGSFIMLLIVYVVFIPEVIIVGLEVLLNVLLLNFGPELIAKNYINSFEEVKEYFYNLSNIYRCVNALIYGKKISEFFESNEKAVKDQMETYEKELEKVSKDMKKLEVKYTKFQKGLVKDIEKEKSEEKLELLNKLKIYLNSKDIEVSLKDDDKLNTDGLVKRK